MNLSLFRQIAIFVTVFISYYAQAIDSVNLDLRWNHQFQFAGYYAAIEKGYYQEEDIQVNLRTGYANKDNIDEVISGRTDFSISNSELIQARLEGKPVVALSALFQYSPEVLLSLKSSGISRAKDLKNKTIQTMTGYIPPQLLTSLDIDNINQNEISAITKKTILL